MEKKNNSLSNINSFSDAYDNIIAFSHNRYKDSFTRVFIGQLNKNKEIKYYDEMKRDIISKLNSIDKNSKDLKDILYRSFWENELNILDIDLCKKEIDIVNNWFYLKEKDCKILNDLFLSSKRNLLFRRAEIEKELNEVANKSNKQLMY